MSLNVSALNDFNNETAGRIVLDTVYKGNTTEYVQVQEGIKFQEPLNLVSVDPYFQGGNSVTNASGSAVFTQRNITVTVLLTSSTLSNKWWWNYLWWSDSWACTGT